MEWNFVFFFNSILLGAGLAMDAFSVSLANGLHEPKMNSGKMCTIAGVFAFFQALMPVLGWICIHTIVQYFRTFETLIPWIALTLLCYIGGKMIYDSRCEEASPDCAPKLTLGVLLTQGIATSIDALSVGFTIASYNWYMALAAAAIIAALSPQSEMGGRISSAPAFSQALATAARRCEFAATPPDITSCFAPDILIACGIFFATAEQTVSV